MWLLFNWSTRDGLEAGFAGGDMIQGFQKYELSIERCLLSLQGTMIWTTVANRLLINTFT